MIEVVKSKLQPVWMFSENELDVFSKNFVELYNKYFLQDIPECKNVCKDIVLDAILKNKHQLDLHNLMRTIHFVKVAQMRTGKFMQEILGCFPGWQSLCEGHETGLDLYNAELDIYIELKNRYNTDNASSRSKNIEKLWKQKQNGSRVIYGIINEKTHQGLKKSIRVKNDDVVEYLSGNILFEEITKIKNFSLVLTDIVTTLAKA